MTKIIAFDKERRTRRVEEQARMGGARGTRERAGIAGAPHPAATLLKMPGSQPRIAVSIVVPTCGRPLLLNRCMASLVLQRFENRHYEIIVVDDGPDDETREVVACWSAHCAQHGPEITYIPSMGPLGPAAARNHGWRAARGEIVAFTDDDAVARADWLRNGVRAFTERVHAVSGRIVMPLTGTPTDYELDAKHLENNAFATVNCFCRRSVLEDLGGFDERFRYAWREDSDLHFRLLEYRAAIAYEPSAVVMRPFQPVPWGVSLVQVKKMQFDALLYKKHPTLYRRKIRTQPRWDFYLTVGALIAALGFARIGRPVLASLFAAVWLLCTARFCLLRLRNTSKSPSHVLEMIVTSILLPPLAVFWRVVGAFKFRAALV